MDNIQLLQILMILAMVGVLIALVAIVFIIAKQKFSENKSKIEKPIEQIKKGRKTRTYRVGSVMNFMNFDTIVDNMIVQMGGKKFIMVVECQGINYDLMSEAEKNGVEEGFIQFLNTLRHPIQIYTQTRSVNLGKSIETYKKKVDEFQSQFEREQLKYNQMKSVGSFSEKQMKNEFTEITRERNLLEYGRDIIFETEKMSLNKSILNRKYYIVIPFFTDDLGSGDYDKNEKQSLAFTELYTKAQAIISTISVCGINAKILTSEDLIDLLYMAYNRDEAESYGVERALEAGYDAIYSTAPDVMEKQLKLLDQEIQREAVNKASLAVNHAKSEIQRELDRRRLNKDELIEEMAKFIISSNETIIGEDVAEKATAKIEEDQETRREEVAKVEAEKKAATAAKIAATPVAHSAPVPTTPVQQAPAQPQQAPTPAPTQPVQPQPAQVQVQPQVQVPQQPVQQPTTKA